MAPREFKSEQLRREKLPQLDYVIEESSFVVKEMPERLRPREAMDKLGPRNVEEETLLAIVLRSGAPGLNVVDLASGLLARFGSLDGIACATENELNEFPGMGPVKIRELRAAMELGRRMHANADDSGRPTVKTPEDVLKLLRQDVRALDAEVFWTLLLDAKNRLNCKPVDVSRGILDASLVHPREVFKAAIRTASAAIVLAHNHPSGDPTPSTEDIRITKQLVETGKIVDIRVVDHVIVARSAVTGPGEYVSMREEGLVDFC